jgi:hypothetical protein
MDTVLYENEEREEDCSEEEREKEIGIGSLAIELR